MSEEMKEIFDVIDLLHMRRFSDNVQIREYLLKKAIVQCHTCVRIIETLPLTGEDVTLRPSKPLWLVYTPPPSRCRLCIYPDIDLQLTLFDPIRVDTPSTDSETMIHPIEFWNTCSTSAPASALHRDEIEYL